MQWRCKLMVAGAVILAVPLISRPRRAEANVNAMWRDNSGNLVCLADCTAGKICCTEKLLPVVES
ncbi:MAG TPA: hypothetical protein VF705_07645 [Longimicrobium sp.]|jgi:hypothetical protein